MVMPFISGRVTPSQSALDAPTQYPSDPSYEKALYPHTVFLPFFSAQRHEKGERCSMLAEKAYGWLRS